jgi:hypothetical protein
VPHALGEVDRKRARVRSRTAPKDALPVLSEYARRQRQRKPERHGRLTGPVVLHLQESAIRVRNAHTHCHKLLELARRLDSKIEIRRVPGELATDRASFVLADEQGYFLLPDHREYQAMANAFDPVQVERLAERFSYLWDRSEADPDLRVLRL